MKLNVELPKIEDVAVAQELPQSSFKGAFAHTDFNTRQPTGLWRSAINKYNSELDKQEWITLGRFKCEHLAAYVFTVHALCSLEDETVLAAIEGNDNLNPDATELAKWRKRSPLNIKREHEAHARLAELTA